RQDLSCRARSNARSKRPELHYLAESNAPRNAFLFSDLSGRRIGRSPPTRAASSFSKSTARRLRGSDDCAKTIAQPSCRESTQPCCAPDQLRRCRATRRAPSRGRCLPRRHCRNDAALVIESRNQKSHPETEVEIHHPELLRSLDNCAIRQESIAPIVRSAPAQPAKPRDSTPEPR